MVMTSKFYSYTLLVRQYKEPDLLNLEEGKLPLDTKRRILRHEAGHQEKVQYGKCKESGTPENNESTDVKVKLTKKIKTSSTEAKVKLSKYEKEQGDKLSLTKPVSPEDETESLKVPVKVEQTDTNKVESSIDTKKNESPEETPVKHCTSTSDCHPGFCCQSKKGKVPKCQKVKLGLGQRCEETCTCKEGLVCHFDQATLDKKKGKHPKNPTGICKEPETVSL
ncbi:uncharacterized protein LOC143254456 [Tachypleus tridentatus]|uniref:uncharacterized protein LOC143254456 n=1 Tax=Tachypleus tridentatus TaxID=6853 RepID=UPI003FCF96C5